MAAGGVVAAVGVFLTWLSLSLGSLGVRPGGRRGGLSPGSLRPGGVTPGRLRPSGLGGGGGSAVGLPNLTVHGINLTDGRIVLALAVALVVVGVVASLSGRTVLRLGSVALGLVLGVVVATLAAADAATRLDGGSLRTQALAQLGSQGGRVAQRLGASGLASRLQASAGPGLYFALAGGLLALVAALAVLAIDRGWRESPAAGFPGPGLPGPSAQGPAYAPLYPPSYPPGPSDTPTEQLPPTAPPG